MAISSDTIEYCTRLLRDPERLYSLEETGLMGSGVEESFDRLTRLASKILNSPLTIVSFIGKDEQYFKSFHGLPEPWASNPSIPIVNSVCQYTFQGEPLIIEDARDIPLLNGNPAIPALNLVAYLGIPLLTREGLNLGAFCAIDFKPRKWSKSEVEILSELTQFVMTEIELKVASKRLGKMVDVLERERVLREKFVMTMTHDLRNPLSSAKLSAEMLGRRSDDGEYVKITSRRIVKNVARVDSMIQTMLDANRLTSGKELGIEKSFVDIVLVVENVVEEMTELYGDRFKLNSTQEIVGNWNAEGLKRVIENLITNAVKYGSESTPISVTIFSDAEGATIEIHNFGDPISEVDQHLLFEPYHRSDTALEGKQKGWGLGLTFVQGMVHAHDGTVTLQSSEGEGTCFKVTLPS